MGANFADNHPTATNLLKGGLSGLGQGLQQYGNPNPQFKFPALGQGLTPNAKKQQPFNASPTQNYSANPLWGGDPNVNGGYYT